MSLHKVPLTDFEREGLVRHGLATDSPSQLSDAFREGMKWAQLGFTREHDPIEPMVDHTFSSETLPISTEQVAEIRKAIMESSFYTIDFKRIIE